MVADEPGLADAIDTVQRVILITSLATLAFVLVRRFLRASAPLRRVLAPVLAGAAGLALLAAVYLLDKLDVRSGPVYRRRAARALRAVPIIFLIGLLRARLARSAIGDLLVDLREPAEPGALRDALARALRDPTLELAYWVPEYERLRRPRRRARRAARGGQRPRDDVRRARRRRASPRSSTTPRSRRAAARRRRHLARPGSRSRTSACRPTCARA